MQAYAHLEYNELHGPTELMSGSVGQYLMVPLSDVYIHLGWCAEYSFRYNNSV